MTTEQKKEWARENDKVKLIAELVKAGSTFEAAFEYVYDATTLTKEQFRAKYFN